MSTRSILVVEDQSNPREAFEYAFENAGDLVPQDTTVLYVNSFAGTKAAIEDPNITLDVIFLDHRLPPTDPGELEETDFNAFSASLQNSGYSLIPEIRERHPKAVIVGTSSMREEISGMPRPDHTLDKNSLWTPDKAFNPLLRVIAQAAGQS